MKSYKFDTLSLHAGHIPDQETGSRAVPHIRQLHMFSRVQKKLLHCTIWKLEDIFTQELRSTVAALEQRLAALEGGASVVACSSGMAAMHLVVSTICSSGDHIVAWSKMYRANINLLQYTMPRFGVNTIL